MNFGYSEPVVPVPWEFTITGVDCNIIGSKNGDGAEWNSIPMLKCDPSAWDVYTVIDYGDPEIRRPGT